MYLASEVFRVVFGRAGGGWAGKGRQPGVAAVLVVVALGLAGCGLPAGGEEDVAGADAGLPDVGEPESAVPFSTNEDHLTVRRGDDYEPFFVKGVNLGTGVPGTRPGELAATREQYGRWLDQMRRAGINTLRIYTLHYPRFYEELLRHNVRHPDDPIYVLHGVWLREEEVSGDFFEMTDEFERDIREVVDCTHGNCTVDHRFGKAYGAFRANVSKWIIGWVLGREIHPGEVMTTNGNHEEVTDWEGEYFRVRDGDPIEVWWGRRLEHLVDYEQRRYGVTRPVSVSSWPTLDPLDHPTENPEYSSEDVADIDLAAIEPAGAPGGAFATYHAYPYYPNFVRDDPDYRMYSDASGPNSYLGYLFDLKEYYSEMPLLIGEFGVPSSWGNAHSGYEDMNHGGHTEVEQGEAVARMFRNQYEANTAGGAAFAWIDEWWKRTWITDERDFPTENRRLWNNVVAPEQHFGLVAFDLGSPDWEGGEATSGSGLVERARAMADAAYFHVRLETTRRLNDDDKLVVGFDTYRDDLGESVLPGGTQTDRRNEFALVVEGTTSARHLVMEPYDLVGIWFGTPENWQRYRSVKSDGGAWNLFRFQNGQPYESRDGELSWPISYDDVGELTIRTESEEATNLDAVVVDDDRIDIRIPWTLLNVTDPSKRQVMHDDPETEPREMATTEGIAISVAHDGEVLLESGRVGWETWDEVPETSERVKRGLDAVKRVTDELPTWIDGGAQ